MSAEPASNVAFLTEPLTTLTPTFTTRTLPNPSPAAPYQRRMPPSLWQREGMEPPPRCEQQEQQHQQRVPAAGRPAGWPRAMDVTSEEVCTAPGRYTADHPNV